MGERYPITGDDVNRAAIENLRTDMLKRQHAATNARMETEMSSDLGPDRAAALRGTYAKHQPDLEPGDLLNRCPKCGMWLSTRYNAGLPHLCIKPSPGLRAMVAHLCEAWQDRADLQTPLEGEQPHGPVRLSLPSERLAAAAAAHALNREPRYPEPQNWQTAPVATARALALAWVCGALAGGLVALLAVSLVGLG